VMIILRSLFATAAAAVLLFSMSGISYQQEELSIDEEVDEDEEGECIEYEAGDENTIAIYCDTSFRDLVQAIGGGGDDNDILEEVQGELEVLLVNGVNGVDEEEEERLREESEDEGQEDLEGTGTTANTADDDTAADDYTGSGGGSDSDSDNLHYILRANLLIANDVTFSMTADEDNLQYLKIVGDNGIIVHGAIVIDGVKITSWDESTNDVIEQDSNGTISRAYIQFDASEGSQIINSEFGYLGYQELGKRGFDLFGPGASYTGEGASSDMVIRDSEFHHMWFAFYSRGAYNIVVDGNEYHHNIRYALDPHSGTRDMNITNNWFYNNPIGVICSDKCSNIIIEGNRIENSTIAGIFFSRNMSDSVARNNYVYNATIGITISESSNNQIYNNTIEGTSSGIRFVHLEQLRDGWTEDNLVYNNTISDSEYGIRVTRSHNNNTVENQIFSNINTSEYVLTGNAAIIISEHHFDDALIRQEGNATNNRVEIVNSGTIMVTEISSDGEDGEDSREVNTYNTNNEPYVKVLNPGDRIIVNS
jgi:mannuronan 5-epimerase